MKEPKTKFDHSADTAAGGDALARRREATRRWRARRAGGYKLVQIFLSPSSMTVLAEVGFLQAGVSDHDALKRALVQAAGEGVAARKRFPPR